MEEMIYIYFNEIIVFRKEDSKEPVGGVIQPVKKVKLTARGKNVSFKMIKEGKEIKQKIKLDNPQFYQRDAYRENVEKGIKKLTEKEEKSDEEKLLLKNSLKEYKDKWKVEHSIPEKENVYLESVPYNMWDKNLHLYIVCDNVKDIYENCRKNEIIKIKE